MNIIFIYIINLAIIIGIAYACLMRYAESNLRGHFLPGLSIKICCGVIMGMLFQFYYEGGDTILFYHKAAEISNYDFLHFTKTITRQVGWTEPMRAIYFVRIVAIIKYFTQADYWLLSAYFSLFSFLGCFYLADKMSQWDAKLRLPVVFGFLYFPSIVFWSSGLLKESLAFGALTFITGTYVSWRINKALKIGNVLLSLMAFVVLVLLKYYIAAVFIPILMYLVLYHLPFWKKHDMLGLWKKTWIISALMIVPTFFFFAWLSPNLTYERFWRIVLDNHEAYLKLVPDGGVHLLQWFDSGFDLFINIPYLWFSGIFRPLLGENMSFPIVFSGLENFIFLVTAALAFIRLVKSRVSMTADLLAILVYVSALSILLSLSAPNFGTLARFKIYYAPFIMMLVIYQLQSLSIFKKI